MYWVVLVCVCNHVSFVPKNGANNLLQMAPTAVQGVVVYVGHCICRANTEMRCRQPHFSRRDWAASDWAEQNMMRRLASCLATNLMPTLQRLHTPECI